MGESGYGQKGLNTKENKSGADIRTRTGFEQKRPDFRSGPHLQMLLLKI